MKFQHIGPILTLLFSLAGCEKELDIEYHDIAPLTVIEGELTPEGIKVGICLTTPMDEPMNRNRLTDARVTLTDITAGTNRLLSANADGFFTDTTPGIAGHEYRLTVERADNVYQAQTVMYPPAEFISLEFNWIKMPYDHVAVLQGQFMDISADEDFYWVKIYRNGEIYQWGEMTESGDVGGVLTFIAMTSRKDTDEEDEKTVLYDGDKITVTLSPVSREMYDYLEALQNDSNGPAMFTGDKCLGYFIASTPVSRSIVFHPDEIPVYQ